MAGADLTGRRVIVVEDDYLIADEMRELLEDSGAEVVGPAPTVQDALNLLGRPGAIDGAVLDVNLRGEPSYGVADALLARGVPFVFVTGYGSGVIPQRYAGGGRCEKPVGIEAITRALGFDDARPVH
ncbi:response regulator [Roseomonas populi]|uniref:Response regulator n=1 Tax=Roseomonas populi TaxID=3121582 RepID=A0ABT1X6V5_9PROT|nr:response regulator [Roseomonas pecuniae]MCR0983841.1 response regulator [Roseomonas pecuniae]